MSNDALLQPTEGPGRFEGSIKCQVQGCEKEAAVSISWRTATMTAPAFWYQCHTHADASIAAMDGTTVVHTRRLVNRAYDFLAAKRMRGFGTQEDLYRLIALGYMKQIETREYGFTHNNFTRAGNTAVDRYWWEHTEEQFLERLVKGDDCEVRHDIRGYYVCTREEAEHEDEGHASAGFDGRPHWATIEDAIKNMYGVTA